MEGQKNCLVDTEKGNKYLISIDLKCLEKAMPHLFSIPEKESKLAIAKLQHEIVLFVIEGNSNRGENIFSTLDFKKFCKIDLVDGVEHINNDKVIPFYGPTGIYDNGKYISFI